MYSWKGTVAYTGRFVFEGLVRPTDWRPLILPGDWWTSSRVSAKLECYVYQEDEEHLVEDKLRESEIKTAWKYTQISHGKKVVRLFHEVAPMFSFEWRNVYLS